MADSRPLSSDEWHALLDSRGSWIALSTLGPGGFPHTVPIGHFRVGDDIYLGCRDGTQKVRNIERDPRVSLMLEPGRSTGLVRGVLIQGLARLIRDADERLELARTAARQKGDSEARLPTSVSPGSVYIQVQPSRTISWHFS